MLRLLPDVCRDCGVSAKSAELSPYLDFQLCADCIRTRERALFADLPRRTAKVEKPKVKKPKVKKPKVKKPKVEKPKVEKPKVKKKPGAGPKPPKPGAKKRKSGVVAKPRKPPRPVKKR